MPRLWLATLWEHKLPDRTSPPSLMEAPVRRSGRLVEAVGPRGYGALGPEPAPDEIDLFQASPAAEDAGGLPRSVCSASRPNLLWRAGPIGGGQAGCGGNPASESIASIFRF